MPALPDGETTLLLLDGMGVPLYSARGLTQTLEPIGQAGQFARDINGTLVFVGGEQFRKYRSVITGTDQQAPALDGVWPGMTITVHCVAELAYDPNTAGPQREAVPGSEREEDDFNFYRPVLEMMVINFQEAAAEYEAQTAWTLELEEI